MPFKATAEDFADSNPIFAYYFYRYYLDAAEGLLKSVDDQGEKYQIQG